ncbi:MAG: outer membrane protein assembly factor BamA [Labilithrix sp.]|nr:outer membrane protein assembly factor BamA [Labilithrix sp.]
MLGMRTARPATLLGPALVGAALLLDARAASAQGTTTASPRSSYEASKIAVALARSHATLEPDPEGKIVEDIDIVPLEVIEETDPAPSFLNHLHTTTRRSVLRSEVLLAPGERYRQYRVDETVRSLRLFAQLSLVLAVATRGRAPGTVRVLLVTKDVWSLRAQYEVKLGAGGLDLLRFEPTERNIGGTLVSAVGRFELYPKTVTLGGAFYDPRLAGERLYLISEGNVVVNRDSGHAEGSYGEVGVSAPQLSADTPFLWGVGTTWADVYTRRYIGAKLATFDAPSTPEDDHVPDVFHTRSITTNAAAVRSFGRAHKLDVSLGAEVDVRRYQGLDPLRHDARLVADYAAARVPTSDDRAAPWAQVRAYESRFLRLHDVEQLGLEEDVRVGYDVSLRAYPVTRALGSSRSYLGVNGIASYRLPIASGFASATTEVTSELTPDDVPQLALAADVALATPSFGIGRLYLDGLGIARPKNYLNQRSTLGGETRLRGYPSGALLGENLVAYNVELRSRPLQILSCQVGTAVFFDVGDAFDGAAFRPKSSVGFGFRSLVPQLDRKVFRVDIAFPLVRGGGESPVGFYLAFQQAFGAAVPSTPGASPTQAILSPLSGAALGL